MGGTESKGTGIGTGPDETMDGTKTFGTGMGPGLDRDVTGIDETGCSTETNVTGIRAEGEQGCA